MTANGVGVMLEGFLVAGRQDFTDRAALVPGQSVTDACLGWDMTGPALRELTSAVRVRRATLADRARRSPAARAI